MLHRCWLTIVLLLVGACAQLPPRPDVPIETALPPGQTSPLDRQVQPLIDRNPGKSGFHLLADNADAFAMRVVSARRAERSLDALYYIWHDDVTGRLMIRELLRAADRGVRVRLLIDDIDARTKDAGFAALAAHPNIAVRLFNPFATRRSTIGQVMEGLGRFKRLNKRMHHKMWIADNRLAISGGRNIGDEYFGANAQFDFLDLDVAVVGPAVHAHSAVFDEFWNSSATWPIGALGEGRTTPNALRWLREYLDSASGDPAETRYLDAIREEDSVQKLVDNDWTLHWTARWKLLSDSPKKIVREEGSSSVLPGLVEAFNDASDSIAIVSPYFVPGRAGTRALVTRVRDGREVTVLTNSLAATDVALVHGGYAAHRRALIRGGIRMFELKAIGEATQLSLTGSSQASLHTKAALVDRRVAFVGSYNLDPRSTSLNTEMGLLIEHPRIAAEIAELVDLNTAGGRAWRVTLDDKGSLLWSDGSVESRTDPGADVFRKIQAWFARVLPIESQL